MVARHAYKSAMEWAHTRKLQHAIFTVNSTRQIDIYELMPLLIDPFIPEAEPMTEAERDAMREEGKRRIQMMLESQKKL